MAENYSLNIQDTASVEEWKSRAEQLNRDADAAVKDAAQALTEFKTMAEGNIFEEVCTYGDGIITGMTDILKGMDEILSAVNKIMEDVKAKIAELAGGVRDTKSTLIG